VEKQRMTRRTRSNISWGLCLLTLVSGCTPTQPFFFHEDGDLSHYMNVATDIEYPDVNAFPLDEVQGARAPLTLANAEDFVIWDLKLEEVTRITLANSDVIRNLGGRVSDAGQNIAATAPEQLSLNAANAATTYDPAIVESGYGGNTGSPLSGTGVEAALADFDAQLDSSLVWQSNDRPQNFNLGVGTIFAREFRQELNRYTTGITKATSTGSIFEIRNNINYDQNNNTSRAQFSDWVVNVEAAFTQPLLQGAGTQYNRIAGPRSFQEAAGGFADQIDGVLISRIRNDITLTEFELGVRNLMRDVEDAYWELYFSYRDLDARMIGRDSALETWRRVRALVRAGGTGGEASAEAQARSQYYLFRAQVETALTNLFRVENRLRYLMGLTHTDGRLIRPIDEPTTAQVHFDWPTVHTEALVQRVELRRQKWQIKRRELELIAAKNQLLPRLDAVGRYRWLGAGDELLDPDRNGLPPFQDDSTAFESLTSGDYQEWELGVQLTMPIGFRRGMAAVRHHQALLARERLLLQEMELEISHQLSDAVRDVDLNYGVAQTNFNRRSAAADEVTAVQTIYDVGNITLDQVLDAQSRRAEAETAYYRSLVDYNRAIMRLHYRKGSLLEYNGVYLAEGPWPGKAYFDALRRARQRDASLYFNYGFTRPSVISRGPNPQNAGTSTGGAYEGPLAVPAEPAGPAALPAPVEELPAEGATPAPLEPQPQGAAAGIEPATLEVIEPLPAVTENSGPAAALADPIGPVPAAAPVDAVADRVPNPFVNQPAAKLGNSSPTPTAPESVATRQSPADDAAIPSRVPWAAYEYQADNPSAQVAGGDASR
jgi:outer membrane protein TolC